MAQIEFGEVGKALNRHFRQLGLIKHYDQVCTINAMVSYIERIEGKRYQGHDKGAYLKDYVERSGISPYKTRLPRGRRRFKGDPFFLTKEWQSLRYAVIRKHGGKCQACGATAQTSGRPMHVDHIIPRSKAPERALDIDNLQLLCEACNLGKGNTDSIDWRKHGSATENTAS